MIKTIVKLFLIAFLYQLIVFFVCYIWGLPPYYRGFIVGFPAIYYQFEIGHHELICGYTNVFNFISNVVIIGCIYYVVKYVTNYSRKRDKGLL
jgi:hypothetical protein